MLLRGAGGGEEELGKASLRSICWAARDVCMMQYESQSPESDHRKGVHTTPLTHTLAPSTPQVIVLNGPRVTVSQSIYLDAHGEEVRTSSVLFYKSLCASDCSKPRVVYSFKTHKE